MHIYFQMSREETIQDTAKSLYTTWLGVFQKLGIDNSSHKVSKYEMKRVGETG